MPAKRRRKKSSVKRSFKRKYIYIFIVILSLIFGLFFFLRTKNWNGKDKLSMVVNNEDLSLSIIVFDPVLEEIYSLYIPGNTEIEVSGGLGVWKVKSLWKLSEQEKFLGEMVSRSITMGLKLPVQAWSEEEGLGLMGNGFKSSFLSLFSSYKSNLTFGDKLGLLFFSTKISNTKRIDIDLSQTPLLDKRELSDGEDGYIIAKLPPTKISAIFSEPLFSSGVIRFSIIDSTEGSNLAKNVGSVVETLGGKVSSVEKSSGFDGVCIIKSKSEEILKILLRYFDCEESSVVKDQSFDAEITLGKSFPKKY